MPALRIIAHQRGGLSVFGPGYHDAKDNQAIALTCDGETLSVVIEYPSAPTAPSASASGLTSTAPAISGDKLTFTLSSIQDNGYADITATYGGSVSVIRIRAKSDGTNDTYSN